MMIRLVLCLLFLMAMACDAPTKQAAAPTKQALDSKSTTQLATPRQKDTPMSQTPGYKLPPQDVIDIIDAPAAPFIRRSPDGHRVALIHYTYLPDLEQLAQPMDHIAGAYLSKSHGLQRRLYDFTKVVIQSLDSTKTFTIERPAGAKGIALVGWSNDSAHLHWATYTDEGMELWITDATTGKSRRLSDVLVTDTMGTPMMWTPNNKALLVRTRAANMSQRPNAPIVPSAPKIQETHGRKAQNRTYQSLLKDDYEDALFSFHMTHQLERVELDGSRKKIGKPGLYAAVVPSPDGKYLLVRRLKTPFSRIVPSGYFPHSLEVWDAHTGELVRTLSNEPAKEEVPIHGVPTGQRSTRWHAHKPSTLIWVKALDGGDPKQKVPHRDEVFWAKAPFDAPTSLLKTKARFRGIGWLEHAPTMALVTDYDLDRRWTTTTQYDVSKDDLNPTLIFDRSVADQYGDPGNPQYVRKPDGSAVIRQNEDGAIYLASRGATPKGDRPFVDTFNLETRKTKRLFHSEEARYESFQGFGPRKDSTYALILRRESPTSPPNYLLREPDGTERALTNTPNPHPQLTGIRKKLLTYERADGTPLSGTLYLPPNIPEGQKVPVVLWAYPRSYTNKSMAGQVRAVPNTFTRLSGTSPLMLLTQGYAVLDDATIPVVGDPKTMNDTFVPQIAQAAEAAIKALAKEPQIDTTRVAVAGHSYGAFMVANLLAHTDVFKAGIARSGAYNRSLTPFGFQSERRTLWEAPEMYLQVSPLFHADKINEPLLLVHGEEDKNSGTFPIQSKRLFHAMQGLGGTARMVVLPHEGHGYRARQSILHVLAETFDWLEHHL